jgi:hypothetical protein
MVQVSKHSSSIDFYAKIMKMKISTHIYIWKNLTATYFSFAYDVLLWIWMVVCKCNACHLIIILFWCVVYNAFQWLINDDTMYVAL